MHAHDLQLVADSSSPGARQGFATVVEVRADGLTLTAAGEGEDEGASLEARRAASCLLAPALGDEVWFAAQAGRCYVLAVVERGAPDTAARLQIPGDAVLEAGGELSLEAPAGLALRTRGRLETTSDELQVQARLGRLLLDEANMVLRTLFSHVTNSTLVCKVRELLTERLSIHSKTSFRSVEQVDQLEAHTIDYKAEAAAHIRAEQAIVHGGELAKVDAGQIHIG